MHSLCKVHEFAGLHLDSVIVVDDIVARLQATVMEVLVLVDTGVDVVREGRPGDAGTRVGTRHVVPDGVYKTKCMISNCETSTHAMILTDDDTHTRSVAGRDHVGELVAVAALRREDVGDGLIVRPPLTAFDMLGCRRDLHVPITGWTDEVFAFFSYAVPVPFEHLDDDVASCSGVVFNS